MPPDPAPESSISLSMALGPASIFGLAADLAMPEPQKFRPNALRAILPVDGGYLVI
jgi:hypothetical protein